ncbi:TPA: hypothetical protein ACN69F_005069, partial [Klebsiella pneumoniae]
MGTEDELTARLYDRINCSSLRENAVPDYVITVHTLRVGLYYSISYKCKEAFNFKSGGKVNTPK